MPNLPIIVAHRGASYEAPENTQTAFVLAWMQGADAIEGDFHLTKDGRIVCVHDETTGRTSNRNMVVARATLESLKQLDFGGWMSPQWRGQVILTLEEVLALVPENKLLFIELKCGAEILEPLKKILDQSAENSRRVVIQSFDPDVIKQARELLPGFKLLLLIDRARRQSTKLFEPPLATVLEKLTKSQADGVNCSTAGLLHDPGFVSGFLATGRELHAWTVNRHGNAHTLQKLGVKSITTNRPGWLKQGLKNRQ